MIKEKNKDRVRPIRMSDETWKEIQKKRGGVSWNKFLLTLIEKK